MDSRTLKVWVTRLAQATWLVNARQSANWSGPVHNFLTVEWDKDPVVDIENTPVRQRLTHP